MLWDSVIQRPGCTSAVQLDHFADGLLWLCLVAATVQDFLERYEVGETVGVGGEGAMGSLRQPPRPGQRVWTPGSC